MKKGPILKLVVNNTALTRVDSWSDVDDQLRFLELLDAAIGRTAGTGVFSAVWPLIECYQIADKYMDGAEIYDFFAELGLSLEVIKSEGKFEPKSKPKSDEPVAFVIADTVELITNRIKVLKKT